jgi:hypothetical protein
MMYVYRDLVSEAPNIRGKGVRDGALMGTADIIISSGGIEADWAHWCASVPSAVGYSQTWLIITLAGLTLVGGYMLRRKQRII